MRIEALEVKKVKPSFARTELGLTQRELGELAGLSHVTIIKSESGDKEDTIRQLTAHRIFNALNKVRAAQGLHRLKFDEIDWNIQGNE